MPLRQRTGKLHFVLIRQYNARDETPNETTKERKVSSNLMELCKTAAYLIACHGIDVNSMQFRRCCRLTEFDHAIRLSWYTVSITIY